MLGWSMHLFRIRGIRLEVHFTLFFLFAVVGVVSWYDAGWMGVLWGTLTLLAFFGCVVLHELGHSFVGMKFGVEVPRILLTPIGGMAEFNEIPRKPSREVLMTLAGPAVNFVIFGLLCLVPEGPNAEQLLEHPYSFEALIVSVRYLNLVMGCFNLFMPVFPMDGGRLVRALLATKLPYVRATFWAASIGKVIALLAIAAALTSPWHDLPLIGGADEPLWMPAILFSFIFFVGEMEYRAVKRREMEEAHWREVLARPQFMAMAPVSEDPPVMLS